jgi:hypothetical protein
MKSRTKQLALIVTFRNFRGRELPRGLPGSLSGGLHF